MDVDLRVMGNPVIQAGLQEHRLRPERRHQLLAYLACRGGWVPRAELAALFWEDHSTEAARRNLRRLLHDIRRIPWLGAFESHGDCLRWQVPSDRTEFARACAAGNWRDAARIGAGMLLDGLLLLSARSTSGHGAFSKVRSIQRLATHGGRAPACACGQGDAGRVARVPYTATYRFYE